MDAERRREPLDPVSPGTGEAKMEHRPSATVFLTGASVLEQRLVGSSAGAARL